MSKTTNMKFDSIFGEIYNLANLGIGKGGRSGGGTSSSFAPLPVSEPPSELLIPLAPIAPIIGTPPIRVAPLEKSKK